ncbi:peptidase M24, structural domain-containing protein [Microdochium bolleyi]|uniref:Peptidase M24, structural domain-containing protein n=1 Tax=Microdochium bolleyi TaxID=196109 RepID=A0A136JC06_9PEZI|nr:peptidase M24, structural domain-containing protein [Microdochium bolleyi]
MAEKQEVVDYSLANPDVLTKYKVAATISEKVLAEVSKLCVAGEKIVTICQKGDKLIEEEVAKVYRTTKHKGQSHPTTVSPSSFVTPYTPLASDPTESAVELKDGELVKIQLGAQIDGFGSIVCDTIVVGASDKVTGRSADLILATYYANELLLRLMVPPGTLASGTDEEKAKAAAVKAPTQTKITTLLEKVAKAYECSLVESTTSWVFERNEIEGKKKIVVAPGEGGKGDGTPELGEVWGVEMGLSLSDSGKVKNLEQRATLYRRSANTYILKSQNARKTLSTIQNKYGHFPFSLRQLEEEGGDTKFKAGVFDGVRSNVLRQYEVVGDKEGSPVARLLTTLAITKNGVTKLGAPPALDLSKYESDKKIEDEEILKILEQPLSRNKGKSKNKKKKPAKKSGEAQAEEGGDDEE